MEKKLNEKQELEATFIKDWCLTVIDFIHSKFNVDKSFTEIHKDAFSEETKQRYLKELSPSIYLKGLRMAFNDTNEMAMDGSPVVQEELNKLLREKFGKDLITYSKKVQKKINKIKEVGKISNEDEYRLIISYIDSIHQDGSKGDELKLLDSLLLNWDK
ncbi:hypothetical protein [Chryseobacterium sp. 2R14A]|uniref:hypothetical protein n=1 Tax=Chryseobacterium sp. 2R14A TaxID=3380353 RepID=UPI003CF880A5